MFKPVFLSPEDARTSLDTMNEFIAELKETPATRYAEFRSVGRPSVDDFLDGKTAQDLINDMPRLSVMLISPFFEADDDVPYTGTVYKNQDGVVTAEIC